MGLQLRELYQGVSQSNQFKQLRKKLLQQTSEAIIRYGMIKEGDRLMVCLSGGKDSYTLLTLLQDLQARAEVSFELIAAHLDQGQPHYDASILPDYMSQSLRKSIHFELIKQNTYKVVLDKVDEGKSFCSLCSRLRRGALYQAARRLKANKLVLGHHADDVIETFFLNLFHTAKLKAMSPHYLNDAGDVAVIRPLCLSFESQIKSFAKAMNYPIIPCNLCGSQPNLERQNIKAMLNQWQQNHPYRKQTLLTALQNAVPLHLLDDSWHSFKDNLETTDQTEALF